MPGGGRAELRHELRELGELRERLLRDLGESVLDMYRSDHFDAELVRRKAAAVSGLDAEIRNVQQAADL